MPQRNQLIASVAVVVLLALLPLAVSVALPSAMPAPVMLIVPPSGVNFTRIGTPPV